ncbi:hypothetical protein AUK22_05235 [bacterium CG2_30_54_10]|nr:MAG: hypothetical protein AUK22_05235 [bacterium CG2_30_54_10]
MLNARRTRDQEIVIAGRIAPKQSRDVGDCFASLAMTTESWSLADLGSQTLAEKVLFRQLGHVGTTHDRVHHSFAIGRRVGRRGFSARV